MKTELSIEEEKDRCLTEINELKGLIREWTYDGYKFRNAELFEYAIQMQRNIILQQQNKIAENTFKLLSKIINKKIKQFYAKTKHGRSKQTNKKRSKPNADRP